MAIDLERLRDDIDSHYRSLSFMGYPELGGISEEASDASASELIKMARELDFDLDDYEI